jgi:hypothetical protein
MFRFIFILTVALTACGPVPHSVDASVSSDDASTPDSGTPFDSGTVDSGTFVDSGTPDAGPNPFADKVSLFSPGPGAGFGADKMPGIVLGGPKGAGASSGSLDVVSLGFEGVIELEFTDIVAIDGPGPDFVVFENGFTGFVETGIVSVSFDGGVFKEFPCETDGGGCAGLRPVFANVESNISATDVSVSGGDAFDLADIGISEARFVRIKDSGRNRFYGAPSGGFDLDAVVVINGKTIAP